MLSVTIPTFSTPAPLADRHDKTLFVMGDGRLPYGRIVEAIDAAKGAGVEKVGIVTESMRRAPK